MDGVGDVAACGWVANIVDQSLPAAVTADGRYCGSTPESL